MQVNNSETRIESNVVTHAENNNSLEFINSDDDLLNIPELMPEYEDLEDCEINYDNGLESLFTIANKFAINLHGHPSYNRKMVYELIKDVQNDLITPITDIIFNNLLKDVLIEPFNTKIIDFINNCNNIFNMINTEHKLFKFLNQSKCFTLPQKITIDKQLVPVIQQPQPIFNEIDITNVYNSIETSLKQ